MVALSQILGACVVSWDANVRVVGHRGTRRGRARPGTEDARRASEKRARDTLSRSCDACATNGGGQALGHHMFAVVARSHASARKRTHWQTRNHTHLFLICMGKQSRRSSSSCARFENVASSRSCRLAKFELRTRAARLTVSGGTRLVRPLYRAAPPRLGRGARRSPWTRLPETCLLRGPSPGRSGSSCSRRPRWRCS